MMRTILLLAVASLAFGCGSNEASSSTTTGKAPAGQVPPGISPQQAGIPGGSQAPAPKAPGG